MDIETPTPGQRWVSDSEPELGLGVVLAADAHRLEILFPATAERRHYAAGNAPIRRVVFKVGDRIRVADSPELSVTAVREQAGLVVYRAGDRDVTESELLATISFSTPEERLLGGHVHPPAVFDLRHETLQHWSRIEGSPVRGFVGPRVELLRHQLSIAGDVADRITPRVLLADEVGLGKTIEAGLILHRLHLAGRADRVLILVPESLVHQWFVELLRRFNLSFSIQDEARCRSVEEHQPDVNPFLEAQLVLCNIGWLAGDDRRHRQVIEAGWDVLVVDEAHNLEWTPQAASPAYRLVEAIADRTPGVLLLTATPQQLGPEGHFARLRLLDPNRFSNLEEFAGEAHAFEPVADLIERLNAGESTTVADDRILASSPERVRRHATALAAGEESARHRLVTDLLDSFGTGRIMFRNTRSSLSGFPERRAHMAPLSPAPDDDPLDPRVRWLTGLLASLKHEKILLICHTRELAEELQERLRSLVHVKSALFHEGLSLIQRDRNAAYFAEDDGARILICSEIGSEGRNFQFAHHLVLFDLPEDPEVLEHRIGRLDRIGQRHTIHVHVPYVAGTPSEVLARWYHEGLNAFEQNVRGAATIVAAVAPELQSLLRSPDGSLLNDLIARSRSLAAEVAEELRRGYDRLLELNSNRSGRADMLEREIRRVDAETDFERFFLRLLDFFGVNVEELAERTYLLKPGHLLTDVFPTLPDDGMRATFDRRRALSREDLAFLSPDHPFARSVMELMLGSEWGNASVAALPGGEWDAAALLEFVAVLESVAPRDLDVPRYLPPEPIRVVVDDELTDVTREARFRGVRAADSSRALGAGSRTRTVLPEMFDAASERAEELARIRVDAALAAARASIGAEIARLEDLAQVNPAVAPDEIAALRARLTRTEAAIRDARIRVAGLRLFVRR